MRSMFPAVPDGSAKVTGDVSSHHDEMGTSRHPWPPKLSAVWYKCISCSLPGVLARTLRVHDTGRLAGRPPLHPARLSFFRVDLFPEGDPTSSLRSGGVPWAPHVQSLIRAILCVQAMGGWFCGHRSLLRREGGALFELLTSRAFHLLWCRARKAPIATLEL